MLLMIERKAAKALRKAPKEVTQAVMTALRAIAADPFAEHQNVTALKGVELGFRLRHRKWRAVYKVNPAAQVVFVEDFDTRERIYR